MSDAPVFNLGATVNEQAPTPDIPVLPVGGPAGAIVQQAFSPSTSPPPMPARPTSHILPTSNLVPIPTGAINLAPPAPLHGYQPNQMLAEAPMLQSLPVSSAKMDTRVDSPQGLPSGGALPSESNPTGKRQEEDKDKREQLLARAPQVAPQAPAAPSPQQVKAPAPTVVSPPGAYRPAYTPEPAKPYAPPTAKPATLPGEEEEPEGTFKGYAGRQMQILEGKARDIEKRLGPIEPNNGLEQNHPINILGRVANNYYHHIKNKKRGIGGKIVGFAKTMTAPNLAAMQEARNPALAAQRYAARLQKSEWYKKLWDNYKKDKTELNSIRQTIATQSAIQQRHNEDAALRRQKARNERIPTEVRKDIYDRYKYSRPQYDSLDAATVFNNDPAKADPKAIELAKDIQDGLVDPRVARILYRKYDQHGMREERYKEQLWQQNLARKQQIIDRGNQVMALASQTFDNKVKAHQLKNDIAELDKKIKDFRLKNAPIKEQRAAEAAVMRKRKDYYTILGKQMQINKTVIDTQRQMFSAYHQMTQNPLSKSRDQKFLDQAEAMFNNSLQAIKHIDGLGGVAAAHDAGYTLEKLSGMYGKAQEMLKSGTPKGEVDKQIKSASKGVVSLNLLESNFGGTMGMVFPD